MQLLLLLLLLLKSWRHNLIHGSWIELLVRHANWRRHTWPVRPGVGAELIRRGKVDTVPGVARLHWLPRGAASRLVRAGRNRVRMAAIVENRIRVLIEWIRMQPGQLLLVHLSASLTRELTPLAKGGLLAVSKWLLIDSHLLLLARLAKLLLLLLRRHGWHFLLPQLLDWHLWWHLRLLLA